MILTEDASGGRSRSSASLGRPAALVVASSANATNTSQRRGDAQAASGGPDYAGAVVGWTVEKWANATEAKVFLKLL